MNSLKKTQGSCIFVASAMLALACGGEEKESASPSTPNSTGGTSSMGGANSMSPPSEGGAPPMGPPLGKVEACRLYVTAQCERIAECRSRSSEECQERAVELCPDVVFAEGSLRSVELVTRCIEVWENSSCTDAVNYDQPDCLLPGDKPLGSPYVTGAQCASGACAADGTFCGACIEPVAQGEVCDPEDPLNSQCDFGTDCIEGLCQPWTGPEPTDPPPPEPEEPSLLGEPCSDLCEAGTVCAFDVVDTRCRPELSVGDPCYERDFIGDAPKVCGGDLICGSLDTCEALPGDGMSCLVLDGENLCAEGFACAEQMTCAAEPEQGEPCLRSPVGEMAFLLVCADGLTCEQDTCTKTVAVDADCSIAGTKCESGTKCEQGVCVFDDESTNYPGLCGL